MKEFFIFSNKEFEGGKQFGNIFYDGNCHIFGEHCIYFEKHLYAVDEELEVYFERYLSDAAEFAKSLKGEFLFVDYNKAKNTLVIITDRFAKVPAYIYDENATLIVSSDYWKFIKLLQPTIDDINWVAVKTMIIHSVIFDCDTLVKNMKRIPTATVYENNLNQHKCSMHRYWRLTLAEDSSLTLQQAAKKTEQLFDNTFKTLKKKFPRDTRFGIGVSGGLDSRLMLNYAKKYNMKVVPFCIGQKYSKYPIKTNGYRVLNKILDIYNIKNFKFIEYDAEDYYLKLADDVNGAPVMSADFMIGCKSQVPDFDVMLNGEHGGVFMGEFNYKHMLFYGIEDIHKYILTFLSYPNNKRMIQNAKEEKQITKLLTDYISDMNSDNKYEIFMRCFFEMYGSLTKTGFFQTIYGSHEAYTTFLDPDFVDFFQTWNMQFLVNRTLQREFYMTYHPKLAMVPDETSDAPLYWRDYDVKYCVRRFGYATMNKLFKSSLRRTEWLQEDKEYKKIAQTIIRNNKDIIRQYFPRLKWEQFMETNPRAFANLIKMLLEINCIIHGGTDSIKEYMK